MRENVIGREIVITPATLIWKVITFTMGCKVTLPFAPSACLLNKCTVKLEEIFVRGPCCGCYENEVIVLANWLLDANFVSFGV